MFYDALVDRRNICSNLHNPLCFRWKTFMTKPKADFLSRLDLFDLLGTIGHLFITDQGSLGSRLCMVSLIKRHDHLVTKNLCDLF